MGSALAKNYDVEKEATCSGGHCYLWQVFKATRKKEPKASPGPSPAAAAASGSVASLLV